MLGRTNASAKKQAQGGWGEELLAYISYMGMSRCEGYGYQAGSLVWNRV